jgi:hypothetical protein
MSMDLVLDCSAKVDRYETVRVGTDNNVGGAEAKCAVAME